MATDLFAQQRIAMVDGQLRTNKITNDALLNLFLRAPRELFAPPALRNSAYVDEELALGHGRFLLEPLVVARLLQAAENLPDASVLVLAAANGYLPRLLCELGARVTAVEPVGALAQAGKAAVPEATWMVQPMTALPAGPFDYIFVGGALPHIPPAWAKALADGGQILCPLLGERGNDGRLVQAYKTVAAKATASLSQRTLANAAVPGLPEFTLPPVFKL